jgi:hypothetical protein
VILFELTGSENHPVYQSLEISNGNRQYDFLRSIVVSSLAMGRPFLSQHVIKALNSTRSRVFTRMLANTDRVR